MTTDPAGRNAQNGAYSADTFNHRDNDTLYSDDVINSTAAGSHAVGGLGLELGYLPPDQRPAHISPDIMGNIDPEIEDGTEAAEALKANADVKVGKAGKIARSVGAQTVRRFVKVATLRGKSGTARGKPPRIPPGQMATQDPDSEMYVVEEGNEEYIDDDSDIDDRSAASAHHSVTQEELQNDELPYENDKKAPVPPPDANGNHQHVQQQQLLQQHQKHSPNKPAATGGIAPVAPNDEYKPLKRPMKQSEDAKDIPPDIYNATMETGRKFLGAVDPHNLLTKQRWRRKKKSGAKKDRKSYVKGKVIDGKHELYALSIAVMLGVRTSIAKTNNMITSTDGKRTLTTQDFMTEEKYEFAPKGSPTTPPHKLSHTFKFKDYAPMAFAYVRRMFGVNEFDFLLSVCGNANFIEFISNAKSGQFFFYSSDGKYMIKTMTNAESKFLRRILPHYFKHCTQNPNTLLPKFYGMYRVKLYHLRRNVKFVIMNSVYYTDKYMQTFYDLKGSVLGRGAKPGQDVLKDNDLRDKLPQEPLAMEQHVRERLRKQIVSDCSFLKDMQIMDYSMLVGIHHIAPKHKAAPGSIAKTGFRVKTQPRRNSRDHGGHGGSKSGDHPDDSSNASTIPGHAGERSHMIGDSKADQLAEDQSDSTKKLILEFRDSTLAPVSAGDALDEEDDDSYLEGAHASENGHHSEARNLAPTNFEDIEFKKEHTIEQIYWPFHRFYDINGHRRLHPKPCYRCSCTPCECEGHGELLNAWKIPDFEPPLSNRKDGGFTLDTTGMEMPMYFKTATGERPYVGKIFFMGIIDILQQYNVRKRAETGYRKVEGFEEPSCVHPNVYATRFVNFFDEFSQPCVQSPPPPPAQPSRLRSKQSRDEDERTEIELRTAKGKVEVDIQAKASY